MPVLITVVIPCYRSELYLEKTVLSVAGAFEKHPEARLQLLLVDDASPDGTACVIRALEKKYTFAEGVFLPENVGQNRAKMQAVPLIRGSFCVFMDDDGQHPADDIFRLIRKTREGYDIVYAQFPVLQESGFRRLASFLSNLTLTLRVPKPYSLKITSFFVLSPRGTAILKNYRSRRPFIGAHIIRKAGPSRAAGIPVNQKRRECGSSRYTLKKLFRAWLSLMAADF